MWEQLQRVYANTSLWRFGLSFSAAPRVAGVETVLSSGYDTFLTILHYRALDELATTVEGSKCAAGAAPMRAAQNSIATALAGPLLWNETIGMFSPSSGNGAHLTDVWGSALAVDTGAVTGERASRIVAWFGAHWGEVVQDGQIRHLPLGQHWPAHAFWEYDVQSVALAAS